MREGTVETIIILGFGLVIIIEGAILYTLRKDYQQFKRDTQLLLQEYMLERKLNNLIQHGEEDSLHTLAHDLVAHVKKKFKLKAKTYSTLIEELRQRYDIDEDIKNLLLDFFHEMIIINYKNDNLDREEKERVKEKIKLLLNVLEQKTQGRIRQSRVKKK